MAVRFTADVRPDIERIAPTQGTVGRHRREVPGAGSQASFPAFGFVLVARRKTGQKCPSARLSARTMPKLRLERLSHSVELAISHTI
jgi:hypothetical protein